MVRFLFTTVTVFHVLLLVYYCHVSSCFASGLLLSQVRFMFTTCHVRILRKKSLWYYCLSFIIMFLCFFIPIHYCLIFLFDTVILSQQGSLLFNNRVLLCTTVSIHKTKRSMSWLTNPITQTDFFITKIHLSYFHKSFIIVLGSID